MKKQTLIACGIMALVACTKKITTDAVDSSTATSTTESTDVIVYKTQADGLKKLFREPDLAFNTNTTTNPVITVNTATQYQNVDAIGLALTGSSAYMLKQMTQANRTALLTELFSTSGINLNCVRLTIGASDFSTKAYTYDDMPSGQTDPGLSNFNLKKNVQTNVFNDDNNYVIPVLKEILAIKPNVYIMASPWSAPAWMKRNGSFYGTAPETDTTNNQLMTGYYSVFANYIVKYIQAMQAEDITIHAVTVQNEPRTINVEYPTMYMAPGRQIGFIGGHLKPALTAAGLSTKIFCGDNNWSGSSYQTTFLANTTARNAVAGSAFHGYGGTSDAQMDIYNLYPDKEIHFTEYSDRTDNSFSNQLVSMTRDKMIWVFRNRSQSIVLWNLALNQYSRPNIKIGGSVSRPVVTIDSASKAVTRNVDYYVLGHASKFLRDGAKVIASSNITTNNIHNVAFQNPDGWITLVVTNTATSSRTVDVQQGSRKFTYTIPASSVITFNWQ